MSRFFASVADCDVSSSDEDIHIPTRRLPSTESSDEESIKRIIRPPKEKYLDEVQSISQLLNNYKKINDYNSLLSAFESLLKTYGKFQNILNEADMAPYVLVRTLGDLQSFVRSSWENKELKRNLTKTGFKSLSALRQKIRKFARNFPENIDTASCNDKADTDNDSFDGIDVTCGKRFEVDCKNSSEWGSDSESNSENENIRNKFLKKFDDVEDKQQEGKRKLRKNRKMARDLKKQDEGEWETVKGGVSGPFSRILLDSTCEITLAFVNAKLKEILLSRRQKRSERRQRIQLIEELTSIANSNLLGVGINLKLKLAKIYSIFDYNTSVLEPIKPEYWVAIIDCVQEMAQTLAESDSILISMEIEEEDEKIEPPIIQLRGSMASILERIIEEFHKDLKQLDPFKPEYSERLKDEQKINSLIDNLTIFAERQKLMSEICRIKLCKIEHFYYKCEAKENDEKSIPSLDLMDTLCKFVYLNDTTRRLRTRAILAQIYHLALHGRWMKARDLMLMSHLQTTVHHADSSTQILYNRAMAQLGLCAFRNGLVSDAHSCLSDLISSGRVREMLGQGFTSLRNHERTHEQEQKERQYQIGIPAMAAQEMETRRRLISKAFYQLLRASERLSLVGPPETMREHVVAATRALKAAKWRQCRDYLFNDKMDSKIWNLIPQRNLMKASLTHCIQKQALKTFIYSYASPVYESLHLSALSAMFELPHEEILSTLSAMIIEEGFDGALYLPNNTLLLPKDSLRSYLQVEACQLVDKLAYLLDSTERSFRFSGQQLRSVRNASPFF